MILVECLTLFWSPAKEATVPNLVPREKLENANQVSLLAAYGTAPVAAILFTILSLLSSAITVAFPAFKGNSVDIALYINALSFLFAAITIYRLKEIPSNCPLKIPASLAVECACRINTKRATTRRLPCYF